MPARACDVFLITAYELEKTANQNCIWLTSHSGTTLLHGIKKQVKIITFIVAIREPTIYVTILFAENKITLSKSDWNSLSEDIKRPLLQKEGNKIINSAKIEIETPLFIFWFLIAW
jgi:hypothetical protein